MEKTTLNTQTQTTNASWLDTEENLSNAALHKIIAKSKFQPPNTENRIIGYGIDQSEVSVIYNWPFSVTNNVKLAMFQFKINHNILYTKDKLKKANLVSDDSCYLCKNETHTTEYMFVKCPLVVHFWKNFHSWWLQNTKENMHLSDTLLYEPIHSFKYQQVLSIALLMGKYFIFKCSLTEEPLTFQVFKLQFHDNTMVERYIAMRNKTKNILMKNGNLLFQITLSQLLTKLSTAICCFVLFFFFPFFFVFVTTIMSIFCMYIFMYVFSFRCTTTTVTSICFLCNACMQLTIGFGFTSDWLTQERKIS